MKNKVKVNMVGDMFKANKGTRTKSTDVALVLLL